jgi:4-diphosphocytidyl-2-C-methyl-D-erythritol kinase
LTWCSRKRAPSSSTSRTTTADPAKVRHSTVELLAPAKINLALHVVGRRPDGYHLLDSIVVFADLGDIVSLAKSQRTILNVTGPFAGMVPADPQNLALRAARLTGTGVEISLQKILPVGAGIGGGSSDAAAVLRGVEAITGATSPDALPLGADVPVCLAARPVRMRGIGEKLHALPSLPDLPMVLVHPGPAVSTAAVFGSLSPPWGGPLPDLVPRWRTTRDAARWLAAQRNDLETAAQGLEPAIGAAKAALENHGSCLLARMSGSGSCVFGLFASEGAARYAETALRIAHPDWWVRSTAALSRPPMLQERRLTT